MIRELLVWDKDETIRELLVWDKNEVIRELLVWCCGLDE